MSLKKFAKIFIPLLFLTAIILGLLQREETTTYDSKSNQSIGDKSLVDYFNTAQELAQDKEPQITKATFLAVGDIMLSRNVAGTIKKANDPLLPFRMMDNIFKSVDFSFGNLESPFSGKDTFNPTGSLVFNAPRDNIKGLVENKFKILNLANNHALDQGIDGLEYTLKYLDENGIKHVGAGRSWAQAYGAEIIDIKDLKIGFYGASYASINDGGKTSNEYVARIEDLENLKSSIQNLKSNSDFIVVTMHAGTEYTRKPNQAQIDFAHATIDAGADMVIGAHPHWVQTIEKYQDKYIFYSLGNFIFDQEWSQETKEGLTLKIQVSKNQESNLQGPKTPAKLDSIELIPVIIENYSTPRPATEEETKRILEKIGQTEKILK